MEKFTSADFDTEASEGGLKELVMRWFTDTQASQILDNGNFPDWFQGFAARKDTEDLLKDKALGCFLIRLSDKTIGYILSYKGQDRCRHFVITQNKHGQFTMRGDCQTYNSLTELIEFHKVSPIQPFREYLTSSCYQVREVSGGELYDVVASQKSGVSVLALRKLWDERQGHPVEPAKKLPAQQLNDSLPPPALPPKCKNRKLAGAVSIDTVPPTQVAPPLPNRGLALNTSLRESSPFTTPHPSLTQVDLKRSQSPRGITNSDQRDLESLYPEGTGREFPEVGQVDNMSRPSGRLNSNVDEDESSSPPLTYSPSRPKKITCPTYSLHEPEPSSSGSNPGAEDAEVFRSNPLYHTTEGSEVWSTQQESVMYSEVPQRSTSTSRINNTYEQVPKEPDQVNMYESVEEMKAKKKSTWGKNNMKWLNFLPDSKKK